MKYFISIILCVLMFAGVAWGAQIIWIEAEDFDPDKSTLVSNVVALEWVIKERDEAAKEAFGKKYILANGSHNKTGSSGPIYVLPDIEEESGWAFWARRITPTSGSDSFFYEVRNDDDWGKPPANQVSGETLEWQWKKGNNDLVIDKGEGNFLRISERESNFSIDVICLRTDGKTPTDEDYEKYLEEAPFERFAVDYTGKVSITWGSIKQ